MVRRWTGGTERYVQFPVHPNDNIAEAWLNCLNQTKPYFIPTRRNHNSPIFLFIVDDKRPWSTSTHISLLGSLKTKSCMVSLLQTKEVLPLKFTTKVSLDCWGIPPELISRHSSLASSVRLSFLPSIIHLASHLASRNSKQKRTVSLPLMWCLRNTLQANEHLKSSTSTAFNRTKKYCVHQWLRWRTDYLPRSIHPWTRRCLGRLVQLWAHV